MEADKSGDKPRQLLLCCANGEGSHNFRVCADYDGVAAFYEEMTGRDQDGTLDSLKRSWEDSDEWSNEETCLVINLYCARFTVWKVDAPELVSPLSSCPPTSTEWVPIGTISQCPSCDGDGETVFTFPAAGVKGDCWRCAGSGRVMAYRETPEQFDARMKLGREFVKAVNAPLPESATPSEHSALALAMADPLPAPVSANAGDLKERIDNIMLAALSGSEKRYRTEGDFIRWGLVQQDLRKAVDTALSSTTPAWVPMKKRQPADFQTVLCVNSNAWMAVANRFYKDHAGHWNGSHVAAEDMHDDLIIGDITHWREPPEAPVSAITPISKEK